MTQASAPTWFGQPRGLTVLFLTNMWEQFSYYGMRALLVYYMTKELLFAQEKSSFIYGTYTAMAYFTPILGGAIASIPSCPGEASLARMVTWQAERLTPVTPFRARG